MIEKCNFKYNAFKFRDITDPKRDNYIGCKIMYKDGWNKGECTGEENCIFYQIYKILCILGTDYIDRIETIRKTLGKIYPELVKKGLVKEKKK